MSPNTRPPILLTAMVVVALVVSVLATVGRAATAPPADASTNEDGANWVPFIGNYALWCTSGNPGFAGCATHHNRPAMDIGMPVGTTIRAAGAGTVLRATNDGDGRGTYVQIRHAAGRTSHYYHLSSVSVRAGQAVGVGQVIGRSGATGSTSSPHLHYEEKNASGVTVEPGVMHSIQRGRLVDYPTAGGSSSWLRVPYGTRIINESYDEPLFADVSTRTWNFDAIEWAVEDGIASGFPDDTWRNDDLVARSQAVMWIWRSAGRPETDQSAPFADVGATDWYRDGIDWAAAVGGMLDQFGEEFDATAPVSRGQMAVMLWARAGEPTAPPSGFTDITDPRELAAADWMAARRYMTGFDDGTFRPAEPLTRGQAVMALYRERLYDDVSPTAWNRTSVDWARWRAFISGYPDHTFRAGNSITRAQTVRMLWRAAGSPAASAPSGFGDVPSGAWYEAAADWAVETGVVNGYPDDTFRGDAPIRRGEFVMMLWRQAGSPEASTPHPFSDVRLWAQNGVSWAAEHRVVTGYPDGTFQGTNPINRGQSVNSFGRAANLPA